ncbi:MAG: response regulator transcription factor [Candidatus Latescibacteria bacterium]|nr:response regulator transcription factor [Candidatus Latescibacterota bacterium]
MKFRTILIDDEPLAVERLTRLLYPYTDNIDIIDNAYNGQEAVEKINRINPDLIFLDIQMPELNGFEVLDHVKHLPLIIFCTAYDEYALKAFETNSIDYLLKPVESDRLKTALQKLQRLTTDDKSKFQAHLEGFLTQIKKPQIKRIQVSLGDAIRFIAIENIFFFRAEDKYVQVSTYDKSYLITKTLNELESELPAQDFIRIHRSAIINMNHLEKIIRWFGSRYRVRMCDKDNTELDVSRGYKKRLGI